MLRLGSTALSPKYETEFSSLFQLRIPLSRFVRSNQREKYHISCTINCVMSPFQLIYLCLLSECFLRLKSRRGVGERWWVFPERINFRSFTIALLMKTWVLNRNEGFERDVEFGYIIFHFISTLILTLIYTL